MFRHCEQLASRITQLNQPRPIAHKQFDLELFLEQPELTTQARLGNVQ